MNLSKVVAVAAYLDRIAVNIPLIYLITTIRYGTKQLAGTITLCYCTARIYSSVGIGCDGNSTVIRIRCSLSYANQGRKLIPEILRILIRGWKHYPRHWIYGEGLISIIGWKYQLPSGISPEVVRSRQSAAVSDKAKSLIASGAIVAGPAFRWRVTQPALRCNRFRLQVAVKVMQCS
jgi:hypothetical protein